MGPGTESVGIWEYDRDDAVGVGAAAAVAQDRLVPPDMDAEVVSSRADVVTVQLARGQVRDPASVLYVERRGTFTLWRLEPWPGGRTLLVLRGWPTRG